MAFIRQSKFRHVFGTAARKDGCYEGFRVTNCAFEGNFIAANKKFVAVCVEVGGAGAFIVIPISAVGRLDVGHPKATAHKEYILDIQWNPYNDNMLATCSEDGTIKIWEIPDHGLVLNIDDDKALLVLDYHERRCTQIGWHPTAANILLSVSQEPKMCVWNLDDGEANLDIDLSSVVWNASWSFKGDKIVTTCKDKMIRIYDARTGKLIVEEKGHEGSKPQRGIFVMNDKFIFTTGFSRMSGREYAIRDASTLEELNIAELDTANGVLYPYYDHDTEMVYLAAKGDSVIRYYELVNEDPYFHYITTFQSAAAQRGLSPIPKRSCDPNITEVMRFYKLHGSKTGYIEPISFSVPRKSDLYQDDIYPDAISDVPALDAAEWLEGKDAVPNRVDMKTFFKGKTKSAGSGGLKKGGLKGLKAKKEAKKEGKKDEPAAAVPAPVKAAYSAPAKEPSPQPTKKASSGSFTSAAPTAASGGNGVDAKVVKELKDEIKTLKEQTKKMENNEKLLQKDIKSFQEKLKDYDKLTADIKILCDAVKKNDERIAVLEGLVDEESDEEAS